MSVVSYLNHQGGLCSDILCRWVRQILLWGQDTVFVNQGGSYPRLPESGGGPTLEERA